MSKNMNDRIQSAANCFSHWISQMNSLTSSILRASLATLVIVSSAEITAAKSNTDRTSPEAEPLKIRENKVTLQINLKVSQSRVFKIDNNRIMRTSMSDPGIAEPVVVCENQFYLLGKHPGHTTFFLWDDYGRIIGIDVHVFKNKSFNSKLSSISSFYRRVFGLRTRTRDFPSFESDLGFEQIRLDKSPKYYEKNFSFKNSKNKRKPIFKPLSKDDKSYPATLPRDYNSANTLKLAKEEGVTFDPKNKIVCSIFWQS